jgi:hypothetical protein
MGNDDPRLPDTNGRFATGCEGELAFHDRTGFDKPPGAAANSDSVSRNLLRYFT